MTLIAGVRDTDGTIYVASDRGVTDDTISYRATTPKVFQKNGFLIGTSGLYRTCQLVSSAFTPPKIPPGMALESYFPSKFVAALQKLLEAGGNLIQRPEAKDDIDGFRSTTGEWLVAVRGRIFVMDHSFSVLESDLPFAAIGNCSDMALGSLATTHPFKKLGAKDALIKAMRVVTSMSPGILAPYDLFTLPPYQPRKRKTS